MSVLLIPACIVSLSFALQVTALRRPSHDSLVTATALRQLNYYRVMRAVETVDRRRLTSTCLHTWFRIRTSGRLRPGELVLLSNGERLYDVGHGVRILGQGRVAGRADWLRFILAGCPHYVGAVVGAELISGSDVETTDASFRHRPAIVLRVRLNRHQWVGLYVRARTYLPLELRFQSQSGARSDLEPGGGLTAVRLVQRAFGLHPHHRTIHA